MNHRNLLGHFGLKFCIWCKLSSQFFMCAIVQTYCNTADEESPVILLIYRIYFKNRDNEAANAATLFRSLVAGFVRKCKCSDGGLRSGQEVLGSSADLALTRLITSVFLSILTMQPYGALVVFMTLSTGKIQAKLSLCAL